MDRQITITTKAEALPQTINGVLQQTGNDNYIIYLNSTKTDDERAAAFLHECLHIYHNDFDSNNAAGNIEQARHSELLHILQILKQEAQ